MLGAPNVTEKGHLICRLPSDIGLMFFAYQSFCFEDRMHSMGRCRLKQAVNLTKQAFLFRLDDPGLLIIFDLPEIERQMDPFRIAIDRRSIVTRVDCL